METLFFSLTPVMVVLYDISYHPLLYSMVQKELNHYWCEEISGSYKVWKVRHRNSILFKERLYRSLPLERLRRFSNRRVAGKMFFQEELGRRYSRRISWQVRPEALYLLWFSLLFPYFDDFPSQTSRHYKDELQNGYFRTTLQHK